jgi:hypothetical protein
MAFEAVERRVMPRLLDHLEPRGAERRQQLLQKLGKTRDSAAS